MAANIDSAENNHNGQRKKTRKKTSVQQQVSERVQILLAPAENNRIPQIAKETGLSQDLVSSWHQADNGQPSGDLAGEIPAMQPEKPPDGNLPSDQPTNQQPYQQQISSYANLEVSGRPVNRQTRQNKGHKTITDGRIDDNRPSHTSWFPQRRDEKMNDVVELRRVVGTVARRWWLILLITLVAAATGFAVSLRLDPVYRASASVIVGQSIQATTLDSRDIQTSERLALSYADIARRQPVLEAVNVALDLGYTWQNLRKHVRVGLVPDTQLLEISVEAGTRDEAIQIADEIARQLILLSPTALQYQESDIENGFVHTRLQALQAKIENGQEKIDELSGALAVASSVEQKATLQAEIDNLESMIVDWEDNYAKFLTHIGNEESTNYLAILEEAHGSYAPIRPVIRLNVIIASMAGLVLALGLVLLLDFLDDTLKKSEDISHDLGLIPLGSVSQFGGRNSQDRKIAANDPFSPVTESYRMIRNNIQFMSLDKPGGSILVTSPAPGDGKSATAVNLAVVMASNGQRTILVDTDLRKPKLHEFFHIANGKGLTNKLRDTESKTAIPLIETEIEGLRLLTAGDTPPNPAKLLGSQRMEQLIAELMDEADVLIFDSPPVAFIADAAVLSQQVDGVVLVVSSGSTRRDISRQAVFNLQQASANILGVILNRTVAKNGAYKYTYTQEGRRSALAGKRLLVSIQHAWKSLTMAIRWRRQGEIN